VCSGRNGARCSRGACEVNVDFPWMRYALTASSANHGLPPLQGLHARQSLSVLIRDAACAHAPLADASSHPQLVPCTSTTAMASKSRSSSERLLEYLVMETYHCPSFAGLCLVIVSAQSPLLHCFHAFKLLSLTMTRAAIMCSCSQLCRSCDPSTCRHDMGRRACSLSSRGTSPRAPKNVVWRRYATGPSRWIEHRLSLGINVSDALKTRMR